MKAKSQTDLVSNFFAEQGLDQDAVTEEIVLPGLSSKFWIPPRKNEIKSMSVQVSAFKNIIGKEKRELAEIICSFLDYKQGITGFTWRVGEPTVTIRYADGFTQKKFHTEEEKEKFVDFVTLILKSKKEILELDWDFGKEFVRIQYSI